eukprot:m.134267 g.134267  ORF g.134267 m.134267 type:complete len:53 (-) comp52441_c0_seq24:927-1085(-)
MRLGGLVVATTLLGYAMSPCMLSIPTPVYTTVGTALCVGSANALSQWLEAPV